MSILDFTKPQKVKIDGGFDGAFTDAGYTPQMSQEDAKKWRAKRFNAGKDGDRIEIRKQLGGTLLLIIVAKDGWVYKYDTLDTEYETRDYGAGPVQYIRKHGTRGLNVRMSMNGPIQMSWELYQELDGAIEEAWALLNEET